MSARDPESNPETGVGYLLHRAHARIREAMLAVLDGTGLNLGQLAVLGALAKTPGLTQTQLCNASGIEKSSMVLFLDALQAEGWIVRRPHPQDRRAHAVFLTEQGAQRLAVAAPQLQAVERSFLEPLGNDERKQLIEYLRRLARV